MSSTTKDRILALIRSEGPITQRQLADSLRVDVSVVSRAVKYLYETGKVDVETPLGRSMRYSVKTGGVLRSPSGTPLSGFFNPVLLEENLQTIWSELISALITQFLEGKVTPQDLLNFKAGTNALNSLAETLLHASPEEIESTRKAVSTSENSPVSEGD